jgi:NMD protein affecting ribosome stability and mRNA decay
MKKVKNSDRHFEYYEAIVQIRPRVKEVLDFAFDLINARENVKVSKLLEDKHGFDIYISDQRFARGTLATQLKRKFPKGKVTITKALYGQHKVTSRLIYRATVLFRLEEEKKRGDEED